MMQPWEVIKQLESDNSRKFKESILTAVLLQHPHDTDFWEGCKFALDPMITFGVKAVPIKIDEDGDGIDFESFALALTGLISRNVTGNTAQDMIQHLMKNATRDQWNNWYRRILIKDLRCGVTETTINKIRPGTIPLFQCQLAKDAADHENKLRGNKILDYKLDGVRVLAVIRSIDDGFSYQAPIVTLHSRNGKIFENFEHIETQLSKAAAARFKRGNTAVGSCVLDGEITSQSFQDLMTQVNRKRNADASDAVFNVFDIIILDFFEEGFDPDTQIQRLRDLDAMFGDFEDCANVKRHSYVKVNLDNEAGQNTLIAMRDEAARLGLEGVMVKDADAAYECKRTASWLKIKPNITVDLTVVNVESGTGRNEGRLGALVCEGDDNGRRICVNVGSGFSDRDRDLYWANSSSILSQVVEVKADAVTQNQDGTYSLRFPRFVRFRGFEPGEKI